MISVSIDFILFIVWIISGIITIIGGFTDDEKKTPILNYILLWITFLFEMLSKMTLTGGLPFGK